VKVFTRRRSVSVLRSLSSANSNENKINPCTHSRHVPLVNYVKNFSDLLSRAYRVCRVKRMIRRILNFIFSVSIGIISTKKLCVNKNSVVKNRRRYRKREPSLSNSKFQMCLKIQNKYKMFCAIWFEFNGEKGHLSSFRDQFSG